MAKTAFTIANADPIDLQSSSLYPTDLFDAIEVNAGLLIFSASQQFLLSTDEAQMTPETARIQFIANYAFDERTVPFSLGVTAGWLNSTAERTRFHEIANILYHFIWHIFCDWYIEFTKSYFNDVDKSVETKKVSG